MKRLTVVSAVMVLGLAAAALAYAHAGSGTTNPKSLPNQFPRIAPTVPRAAGDRVPASAATLVIAWTTARSVQASLRVTSAAKVRRAAELLNSLPQEGRSACAEGLVTGPPSIMFSFQDKDGRTLARTRGYNGTKWLTAYCVPTLFTRRGRSTIRLEDNGLFLRRIRMLLDRQLGTKASSIS